MTTTEAGERWHVSPSLVARWCREGRVKGARKVVHPRGDYWTIPERAKRPKRMKRGRKPKTAAVSSPSISATQQQDPPPPRMTRYGRKTVVAE